WENKEKDSRQIILNLNQQILMLQNNLQNMTAIGDLTAIPAITNLNDANKVAILKDRNDWRLAYEKFLPNDTPETYEMRICPLLLGIANDDANALSFLMNHLPDGLFNRMESANPANINAFFTDLKKLWLKHRPSSFNYGSATNMNGMVSQ
ncbi:11071_t:CDS:2, partial [Entrophospora sp. SA101]